MDNVTLRRFVYGILLTVTAGITTARIVGAENVFEPSLVARWPKAVPAKMPTFGANDRSRWAAIRALVETGTFAIGERHYDPTANRGTRIVDGKETPDPTALNGHYDTGITFQDGYQTIDMAKDPETEKFYSTKPPLFVVLAAGEYWLLRNYLGWSLEEPEYRWPVVCTILITFNVFPLLIYLILLAKLLEEYGTSDWGRLFVFASACFGTFMTTFAVTLNNHTPAAVCAMAAIYPLMRGRSQTASRLSAADLVLSGFFASLTACFDLPAASLCGAIGCVVLFRQWKGLVLFIPAALIPAAAFLAVNYLEVGTIVPIYSKVDTDWYLYDGSHWARAAINPNQKGMGIDFAREPKTIYAFHMLVGHHGLFSLTPIWLLAVAGMLRNLRAANTATMEFHFWTLVITVVVVGFYVMTTNNYEGWTSGPRWQFWLTPLFLLAMLPTADKLGAHRPGRILASCFLAISAFSASYPIWNPWRHPWPYVLCEYMDWVKY